MDAEKVARMAVVLLEAILPEIIDAIQGEDDPDIARLKGVIRGKRLAHERAHDVVVRELEKRT